MHPPILHSHASKLPQGGRPHTVVGLGDPVMDILLQVSEQFLASVADRAGGCVPIGSDEMDSFLSLASDINKPLRYWCEACGQRPVGSQTAMCNRGVQPITYSAPH